MRMYFMSHRFLLTLVSLVALLELTEDPTDFLSHPLIMAAKRMIRASPIIPY